MNNTEKVNFHAGHRQRVKKNALDNGLKQLEDHRVLELLLFYSIPREDTNPLAHKLLDRFGSFAALMRADKSELMRVEGVGESTALLIMSLSEIYSRSVKQSALKSSGKYTKEELIEMIAAHYVNCPYEKLSVFCFDSRMRFRQVFDITEGNAFSAEFDFRKVIECVIQSKAVKVIVAHNHPETDASPSCADVDVTRMMAVSLRKIGVSLTNHVIVGGDGSRYLMNEDKRFNGVFG